MDRVCFSRAFVRSKISVACFYYGGKKTTAAEKKRFARRRCDGPPPPKYREKSRCIGDLVRMRRYGVGVWIEKGSKNGRTTPTREGIVPCRPASRAGRERVWGQCVERGQTLGSRWVEQPRQEVAPFLSIRIGSNPTPGDDFVRH